MVQFYPNGMIHEDQYAEVMETIVTPALQASRKDQMVPGKDGNPLFVSLFPAKEPKGTVIMLHGFTESVEKYREVIYALNQAGYTVGMHDQRGHGRSWREDGVASTGETHVEHFDDYVEDLDLLMKTVYQDLPRPFCVLGHSMGGAAAALYLENHPAVFDRAILTSPMIAPKTSPIPSGAALMICRTMQAMGKGKKRIMMSRGYQGHEDFETSAATSKARFAWYDDIKYQEKIFQNSTPTYGWTLEAIRVTDRILKEGEAEKIAVPVLVLQASDDYSVLNEPMDRFTSRLKYGKKIRFEGARHEIFRSVDQDACRWMDAVLAFLAS